VALTTFNTGLSGLARRALGLTSALVFALGASVHAGNAAAREIDTAKGTITIQGTPQRVVTLSENALDTALALGVKPVGAAATRGSDTFSDYLKDKAGKPAIVGTAREVNLEAVFALQPDLILASPSIAPDIYAKLSMLAPTIVPKAAPTDDWRKTVDLYAQALDREAELQQGYEALDKRIGELKARLKPDQTVSVVRWNPQGPIVMSSRIFVGQLLHALGLRTTELSGGLGEKPHSDVLSLENLGKIDADWLFVAALNPQGQETLDAARKQPAFERLGAVRNQHVFTVDGQVWTSGAGLLAADVMLDDIEATLLR